MSERVRPAAARSRTARSARRPPGRRTRDPCRVLRVGRQIEVGAVRDTLELAPLAAGEAETVLDVCGTLRVVRELLFGVVVEAQV